MRPVSHFVRITIFALFVCIFLGKAEAATNDRIRLGVVGFTSKAAGVDDQQASIISDLFTRTLASSQSISVIEREQISKIGAEHRFNMSGLVDPSTAAEIGRIMGLQYMLLGSVTELSEGGSVIGFSVIAQAQHDARATIDARVVDVATAEVLYTFVETGSASEGGSAISIGGFSAAEASFGGIKSRAIADAVNRMAHNIRSEIGNEDSYVTSANGSEIRVNVGSSLGVQRGALYLVYVDGANETDPVTGRVLGKNKLPIAVVKVDSTQSGFSACTVASGTNGKLIQRGDKIAPISAADAKRMVEAKQFPKERPAKRAYDDTFDALFSDGSQGSQGTQGTGGGTSTVTPAPNQGQEEVLTPAPDTSAPEASEPRTPAPQRSGGGSYKMREVAGVDPDNTTDAKLIEAYDFLTPTQRNTLGIGHRGAYKTYSSKRYKDAFEAFTKLADDYPGNYLSAYWAGMSASRLKSYKEAVKWFDRTLEINPNYQPAIDGRAQAEASENKKK
ncbi:MAG: hypothetical protein LBQ58_10575 [Synergistaceae bacterium]|jgi:curli biogenesis system outer membrane secretion channel CsgG|nr:hypothetical protein [Synergistaceae bacterium]